MNAWQQQRRGENDTGISHYERDLVFGGGGYFLLDIIVARLSEGVGPSSVKVFFNFGMLLHIVRNSAPFHPALIFNVSGMLCLFFYGIVESAQRLIYHQNYISSFPVLNLGSYQNIKKYCKNNRSMVELNSQYLLMY